MFFDGEPRYERFPTKFMYKGKLHDSYCTPFYNSGLKELEKGGLVDPGETIEFFVVLVADFLSEDNYIEEAMELLKTLQIEYVRVVDEEEIYRVPIPPFTYNSATLTSMERIEY